MEKNGRVCGICGKCFSSGKAMGGHMRSHLAKLPIPPKPETKNQALDNSADLTQCPIQSASSLTDHPKNKQTQNFQSLKRNSFALANSNTENESGSHPKNPTRRRSKCRRELIAAADTKAEPKQMSPTPETLHAEEAAWTLLMLSSDIWPEREEIMAQKMKETNKMEPKDGENGGDDSLVPTQSGARFKCEKCGKMFRSHQALGGHKANHKKTENLCREGGDSEDDSSGNISDVDQKVFQCPYCYKVFKSAQALGGHKKVHFPNTMVANAHTGANEFRGVLVVDLNFPAPGEDEEVSHTHNEFSSAQ